MNVFYVPYLMKQLLYPYLGQGKFLEVQHPVFLLVFHQTQHYMLIGHCKHIQ